MRRSLLIERLQQRGDCDLAVIGGGATGLGVALDAALRGFSVVLIESHDFASGTSSRSTKLLHGGVRYLAQGDLPLVREALAERATVLGLAPHLAQPLPFVMPSTRCWQTPFYGLGLSAYDLLAGRARLGRTAWLSAAQTAAVLPGLAAERVRGGVKYWDGQFEDARLALALARTLERAGGLPLNHLAVTAVRSPSSPASPDGRFELDLQDRIHAGLRHTLRARAVVNATGVWVDEVRRAVSVGASDPSPQQTASDRLVVPSQGVHLVLPRSFMRGDHALLIPRTADGRVLFAVPWLGAWVLGTTDTPRQDLPREPQPFDHEIDFILREAGQVLARAPQRADVLSVWVGLRPLVAAAPRDAGGPLATKRLSREHTIVTDPSGLITVTGGKWTTYRAMAEDVLDACFRHGTLPKRPGPTTRTHRLVGAPEGATTRQGGLTPGTAGSPPPLSAPPGLHLFGTEADAVRALPGADRALGLGLTEAMVRFAARHEYALTVEDMLARRWRALFLDARQAARMAPEVAKILGEETGVDPDLEGFLTLAGTYTLDRDSQENAGPPQVF